MEDKGERAGIGSNETTIAGLTPAKGRTRRRDWVESLTAATVPRKAQPGR